MEPRRYTLFEVFRCQNERRPIKKQRSKDAVLSYADFVAIVGKDQINTFETLNEQELTNFGNNQIIIYKI